MYTLYLALVVAVFVAVVPALLGLSLAWTLLPGMLLGIFSFVWVNRRVAKRIEAVTQAADNEMASLQAIARQQSPNEPMAMAN